MASLLDLAQKMGISTASNGVEIKTNSSVKRRPWLEEEEGENSHSTSLANLENKKTTNNKQLDSNVKKGELARPQNILQQKDNALKKIEIKTDKLIVKAKQLAVESQIKQRANRAKKEVSISEFNCLKGLAKLIIIHIKDKAIYDDFLQKWISIIDTEDLKLITKKTAHHLAVQISRLEKQGWFQIINSRSNGVRLLEIDPEIYTVNTVTKISSNTIF